MKHQKSFILTLAFALSFSCLSKQEKENKPNIVFIFTDQQNVKAISAHGNPFLHTPNMDFLVENGVSFMNSYCTSPVCAPSRSSLITGLMPHETGVVYNGESMNEGIRNVGHILKNSGYETIWAGKWHLPDPYPARHLKDSIPGFKVLPFYNPDSSGWELGGKTDKPLADAVVRFIDGYSNTKPFLLCISFHNPHDICYFPRRPELYLNPNDSVELPPLWENHEISRQEPDINSNGRKRDHYGDELLLSQNNDETQWRSYLWHYYRRTEKVDVEIGRVIHALQENGLEKNTMIIFSSDHGDGMGEKKWAAKLSLYDAPAKVPFILYFKNKIIPKGIDSLHLVSGIDLAPTILDYAGVQIPENLKGVSLKKLIDRPKASHREYLVTELAVDPFDKSLTGRMIRTSRFKYNVYSKGEKREELFDIVNDPYEMNDLSAIQEYQSEKEQLRNQLKEWAMSANDPFIDHLIP